MIDLPSYLIVVPSSCQMYSGTGRSIFDWIRFAKKSFKFSMLMDLENVSNFTITRRFCQENDIPLYPSHNLPLPGCIDSGIREISDHLAAHSYHFIECVSWANAATHLNILAAKGKKQKLVYTPHSQPLWTIPDHERYFMVPIAFKDTLNAADFIFIDSPAETLLDAFSTVGRDKIHCVPLGIDTEQYCPGSFESQAHQILCICDFREQRKRIDLLLNAFSIAYADEPKLRLVLAGNHSESLQIPKHLAPAVTQLGYIEEHSLIDLYRSSALYVLLSDYEAFGLPIAEALCCGCPVLLNQLLTLEALFSSLEGVTFTNNKDIKKTAQWICQLSTAQPNRAMIASQAMKVFSLENTYGRKRSLLLNHL